MLVLLYENIVVCSSGAESTTNLNERFNVEKGLQGGDIRVAICPE